MARKPTRQSLKKKLDKALLEHLRRVHRNRCVKCGKIVKDQNSQTSHIVPKGNGINWRRFDPHNAVLMCFHCHIYWWHKNPTESGRWFAEKYGDRDKYLDKYRGGKPAPISTDEMKELLAELKGRNDG